MGRITKSPTVGTILVGRREIIEQIEFFPPASDHIPNAGKKVVGGDGEVKLRPGASVLPMGWSVGAGATAWGCGLFRFAPRWMASVAGAWGRGVGLRPFLLPTHTEVRRGFHFSFQ